MSAQAWYVDERSGVRMPAGLLRFPVDRCHAPAWNPNKQDVATFKNLVDNVRVNGFLDIPQIAPIDTPDLKAEYCDASCAGETCWLIIGGAHRKDAAKMLDMEVWPAILIEGWSDDMIRLQNMRLNSLRGKVDPAAFLKLFEHMKGKGYADEMLQHQMGLVQRNAMKKLLKAATQDLPSDVKRMVAEREDEINSPDDLARVLKELFSKHGDTLPFGFMVFDFGGKTNLWVRMSREVKDLVDRVAAACADSKVDVNRVMEALLADRPAVSGALKTALASAAEEDDIFV